MIFARYQPIQIQSLMFSARYQGYVNSIINDLRQIPTDVILIINVLRQIPTDVILSYYSGIFKVLLSFHHYETIKKGDYFKNT